MIYTEETGRKIDRAVFVQELGIELLPYSACFLQNHERLVAHACVFAFPTVGFVGTS